MPARRWVLPLPSPLVGEGLRTRGFLPPRPQPLWASFRTLLDGGAAGAYVTVGRPARSRRSPHAQPSPAPPPQPRRAARPRPVAWGAVRRRRGDERDPLCRLQRPPRRRPRLRRLAGRRGRGAEGEKGEARLLLHRR